MILFWQFDRILAKRSLEAVKLHLENSSCEIILLGVLIKTMGANLNSESSWIFRRPEEPISFKWACYVPGYYILVSNLLYQIIFKFSKP
jgi:hypothetical protein